MLLIIYLTNQKFMQVIILMGGITFSMYQLYELVQELEASPVPQPMNAKIYGM